MINRFARAKIRFNEEHFPASNHVTDNVQKYYNYAVTDGEVTFTDPEMARLVQAAQIVLPVSDPYALANVKLAMDVFSEEEFKKKFPFKDGDYTYENLIYAISYFPAFCGEYKEGTEYDNLQDGNSACKRELATLLAHIAYETYWPDYGPDIYSTGLYF